MDEDDSVNNGRELMRKKSMIQNANSKKTNTHYHQLLFLLLG